MRGVRLRRTDAGIAIIRDLTNERGEIMRVLQVGGVYQSATYLGERWHEPVVEYYRAFDRAFEAEHDGMEGYDPFMIRRVLMIGGGGCSYPKHLLMTRPDVALDVVEADARVIGIARRFFFVDRLEEELSCREGNGGRFSLMAMDGETFLRANAVPYDLIINDAFEGARPDGFLSSSEGAMLVEENLTDQGLYIINVVVGDDPADHGRLHRVIEDLGTVFRSVSLLDASDEALSDKDNYLVVATNGLHGIEGSVPLSIE